MAGAGENGNKSGCVNIKGSNIGKFKGWVTVGFIAEIIAAEGIDETLGDGYHQKN